MARVVFPDHLLAYTGDTRELELEVSSFRELVRVLEARFPGIGEELLERSSVAIDGEISHEPYLEAIAGDSEVHFLVKISGG